MLILRCYGRNGFEAMTNQEILEKAIEKSIDGGLDNICGRKLDDIHEWTISSSLEVEVLVPWETSNDDGLASFTHSVNDIIFNHDFAKALWGAKPIEIHQSYATDKGFTDTGFTHIISLPCYLVHLQEMVISPDPIKYLGQNI